MPALSVLIKPASSSCNMRCAYCFYSDVAHLREVADYGMMSVETLDILMQKAFAYAEGEAFFGFQGGEPTLAGLDFFRAVVALEQKWNQKGIRVHNAIQTNGLCLNAEWARFLRENRFLVGLSLDGTQAVHDAYRVDAQGKGTFERVLAAARLLEREGVEFNILSTVNLDVAQQPEKIYYFFKKQKFRYLQFIPCLDEFRHAGEKPYSLTAEAYGEFLVRLFDLWYVDLRTGHPVSIRWFDNLATMLAGYPPESCGMAGCCSCYFMVEADGSVYPCDFYVTDEWRLGNIHTHSLEELRECERAKEFVDISRQVAEECRSCPYAYMCRGGCRREREPIFEGQNTLNRLCPAFRRFFAHAGEDLKKVARAYLKR